MVPPVLWPQQQCSAAASRQCRSSLLLPTWNRVDTPALLTTIASPAKDNVEMAKHGSVGKVGREGYHAPAIDSYRRQVFLKK